MNKLTCFELNIQDHIAHLVLNRPDALNTLDMVFWRELDEVLQQLHQGNQFSYLEAFESLAATESCTRIPQQ